MGPVAESSSPNSSKKHLYLIFSLLAALIFILLGNLTDAPPDRSPGRRSFKYAYPDIPLSDDVTIVTALVNIGKFQKGGEGQRGEDQYIKWMHIWQKIKNDVIFFTENRTTGERFLEIRKAANASTKIVYMSIDYENPTKSSLWSVRLLPNITKLFQRPGYPKHPPNTVVPKYSMVMNLKFDSIETAILTNPYLTKYFAWVDIGLFRDASLKEPCFELVPPPDYSQSMIAANRVGQFRYTKFEDIVKRNWIWIGGTLLFAHKDPMLRFVEQYRETAEAMIRGGWYSTDQQTIYSMYADPDLAVTLDVQLQLYSNDGKRNHSKYFNGNYWWYLGYLMRKDLDVNCTSTL